MNVVITDLGVISIICRVTCGLVPTRSKVFEKGNIQIDLNYLGLLFNGKLNPEP